MSKISEKNYETDVMCEYQIESVNDRIQALGWIAKIALSKKFDIRKMEAEDFLSYHDGTETKLIGPLETVEDFVKKYEKTSYKAVNITASLADVPFFIGINLDTQKIVLGLQTKYSLQYKNLETLLGL